MPEPRDQMDTDGEGERGGEEDVKQGARGVWMKMASSAPAQRMRSFVLRPLTCDLGQGEWAL